MADGSGAGVNSLKGKVSAEEWQIRVELAALYRLVALHGWDDLIYTHISARLPGPEHQFLINPYGLLFEEITASSLVKIDHEGKILEDGKVRPLDLKVGDKILFGKYGGTEVKVDGEELLVMREEDVMAVIEK